MRYAITAVCVAMLCPMACFGQALADHIPADAVIYIGWKGANSPGAGYDASHLKAVLEESELPQFFSDSIPALLTTIATRNPDMAQQMVMVAKGLALAADYWKYPVALYVGPGGAGHPSIPNVALICDAGPDVVNLGNQLGTLLNQAGITIMVQAQDPLVIAANFTYPPQVEHPLSADPEFVHLMSDQIKDPVTIFYMDGAAALGMVDQAVNQFSVPDFQQHWPQIRQASGLMGLQHIVSTQGFERKNWMTSCLIESSEPRTGLLSLLDAPALSDDLLARIPESATLARAGNFDLNATFTSIQKLVGQLSPDAAEQFTQGVQTVNSMIGLDIQKDLLAALGTQWAFYLDPASEGQGFLGAVLVNEPADAAKLADSLHKLQDNLNGLLSSLLGSNVTLEFAHETVGGVELNYFAVPFVSPTWAIRDGTLYMGLFPQVVATALARPADARSILSNQGYMFVHSEVGASRKPVSSFYFIDLPKTAPESYQSIMMVSRVYLGIGDLFGAHTPAMVLPTLAHLMPELEPSGGAAWSDAEGWHSKQATPFPGADVFGAGDLWNISPFEIAGMTSVMLPSLNKSRETANRVKCANNLRQIGLACALYCNDNRGKYPPDLGTLIKTEDIVAQVFVCPSTTTVVPPNMTMDQGAAWVNANSDYVYLGAGLTNASPADTIVAYEKDGDHNGAGINMLFADGHVEFNTLPAAHQLIEASKRARGL